MTAIPADPSAYLEIDPTSQYIVCRGRWALPHLSAVQKQIAHVSLSSTSALVVDTAAIHAMDTAGAYLLHQLLEKLKTVSPHYTLLNCAKRHQELLKLVQKNTRDHPRPVPTPKMSGFERIGRYTIDTLFQIIAYFDLLGEIFATIGTYLRHPKKVKWRALFFTLESCGYQALPIIGVLSFLIGIVLAYQMGLQLRNYGANIFAVNFIGLSLLREFAPLITAIIMAGRSGSAFTAQLGTMVVNKEIDALRTMGIAPVERLVLQKFFGLIIALPLLTVWSNITGVLGGMVMANTMLGIGYGEFLTRFQQVIPLKTYLLGLLKTPFFAIIIASIGCFQGFQVSGSAESVGQETTKSVVRAIFLIICADAVFSVLFSWYKL